jgi:hypothetical protein
MNILIRENPCESVVNKLFFSVALCLPQKLYQGCRSVAIFLVAAKGRAKVFLLFMVSNLPIDTLQSYVFSLAVLRKSPISQNRKL